MSKVRSSFRSVPWNDAPELRQLIKAGSFGKPAGLEYRFIPIRPIPVSFLPVDGGGYTVAVAVAYAPTGVPGVKERYLYCLAFGAHGGVPGGVDMSVYRAVQSGLPEPEPRSWQCEEGYFYYGWVTEWLNSHLPQVAKLAFWAGWAQATDSVVPFGLADSEARDESRSVILVYLAGTDALSGTLHRHLDPHTIVLPEDWSIVGQVHPPKGAEIRIKHPMLFGEDLHLFTEGRTIKAAGANWIATVVSGKYLASRGLFP